MSRLEDCPVTYYDRTTQGLTAHICLGSLLQCKFCMAGPVLKIPLFNKLPGDISSTIPQNHVLRSKILTLVVLLFHFT